MIFRRVYWFLLSSYITDNVLTARHRHTLNSFPRCVKIHIHCCAPLKRVSNHRFIIMGNSFPFLSFSWLSYSSESFLHSPQYDAYIRTYIRTHRANNFHLNMLNIFLNQLNCIHGSERFCMEKFSRLMSPRKWLISL